MPSIWTKTRNYIIDLVYPKECVGCNKEGVWLCRRCQSKIIRIKTPYCPKCKKITKNGQFCRNCRQGSNLSGIIIASHYQYGPTREAIHIYKYSGILELENYLGGLIIQRLNNKLPLGKKVIVPIPLHYKKEMKRGFNQAERLAKILAQEFNLPLETNALKRTKETKSQINLNRKMRQQNIENAFSIREESKIKNKTVLLVDDVTTTGMTLDEAAKILKENGARKVWGVVIAQG